MDLEAKDDRPDQAQGQTRVTVDDVVSPEVLQMDSLLVQKGEGFVHVFQAVNSHLALGGFLQTFSGEDFEQLDEELAIAQVGVEIRDTAVDKA